MQSTHMFWCAKRMTRDRTLPISGSIRSPRYTVGRGLAAVYALVSLLAGGALSSCAVTPVAPQLDATPITIAPQRDWSDAILYFVFIDRFADGDASNNTHVDRHNPGGYHGGDLQGLAQQLDEIAALGATAIWINPVVKQIDTSLWAQGPPGSGWESGFEHRGFHGYWAEDFERIEPRFGSEAELKALVEAAHARGLKVLLDVVYNHPGYGAHYLTDPVTRNWLRKRQTDCAADPLTCQVGGLPDLRTEDREVREYLFGAHIGLAKRTGVDGFRLDTVKHVEHDFWQVHRARTKKELGHEFFLLGEVWGGSYQVLDEWFAPDELDAGFDFSFKGNCQSFVNGRGRTIAYAAYLKKRHKVRNGHYLAHYMSSHDEPMALYELGYDKDKFKLCVTLQMTSLGIPVIFYGEEVGRLGSVWPTNRKDMPWGNRDISPGKGVPRDDSLRDYYKRLIKIRRAHPALSRGDYRILSDKKDELLVFGREDLASGDTVIVAVNRSNDTGTANIALPESWQGTSVHEEMTGGKFMIKESRITINVPAKAARIYVMI